MALEPGALETQLTSNSTVPLSVNSETVCKEATRPLQWTTEAAAVGVAMGDDSRTICPAGSHFKWGRPCAGPCAGYAASGYSTAL